jgi:protein gp37
MAENSSIEWTDTTWNPVTGCTKISVGCDNCYAARFSERFRGVPGHPFEAGFDLTLRPERLTVNAGEKMHRRAGVKMHHGRRHSAATLNSAFQFDQ